MSPRTVPLSAPRALPEPAPLAASLARALPARRHARTVWPLLVAAAALGAAAAGLAGCLRARRARLDAALEAELQQMIAEARAEDAAGLRSR